jgi:hypothetical protein
MYPEDRVLVGVVKSLRDLRFALDDGWYRIPQAAMPRGVHAEVVALFLSGKVFGEQSGTVAYYGRVGGLELAYRRDLVPSQPNHARANLPYYRVSLHDVTAKQPPIRNRGRRRVTFIYTTWDRFVAARTVRDLYSRAAHFVPRIESPQTHPIRSARILHTDPTEDWII